MEEREKKVGDPGLSPGDLEAIRAARKLVFLICSVISLALLTVVGVGYTRAQKPAKEAISSCFEQLPDVCAVLDNAQITEIAECAARKVRGQVVSGEIGESSLVPNTKMVLEAMSGSDVFSAPSEK